MKTLKITLLFLISVLVFFKSPSQSLAITCQVPHACCFPEDCQGQIAGETCGTATVCCSSCKKGGSLGQIGGNTGFGPWGNLGSISEIGASAGAFTKILSNVIGVMTIIAGLWFMFQFIIGGYAYMSAGEDPQRMGNATKKITSSLIGLVIVVAAYAIISLIGSMLGFEILNPQNIITKLGPN